VVGSGSLAGGVDLFVQGGSAGDCAEAGEMDGLDGEFCARVGVGGSCFVRAGGGGSMCVDGAGGDDFVNGVVAVFGGVCGGDLFGQLGTVFDEAV